MDQAVVAREHESIDKYSGTLAFRNFLKRLCHNQRIKTKSIFVNAAIFESQSRGLAIRDHHDLPHIFLLAGKNALRESKPLSRVRVIRPHLDASQFTQRNFLRAIVKK